MPRTKKPAGTAVDSRNGRRTELAAVLGERFDPPPALCKQAIAMWEAFWSDAVATVTTAVDRGVLTRWITEYDRYLRTVAEADLQPLVEGSQGQSVENPLYRIAYRALDAAERCERQMGVGALNRSSLGIAVITERKSLADMNARYGGDGDGGDSTSSRALAAVDPRVIDAQA